MVDVNLPRGTGQVAVILGVSEERLQRLVRRGIVRPTVIAGRRIWTENDITRAASAIGTHFRIGPSTFPESPAHPEP